LWEEKKSSFVGAPTERKAPFEDHSEPDLEDAREDFQITSTGKKNKKKRDGSTLRKAPQAPKRFKSSYICFFMAKQQEIKDDLGDKATVTEISKRSAQMWRNLPCDERAHWDDVAAKDKQRYMVEKASYTGPWQVPWKRAKKDPSAPKRPMSAFLYFSQGRRRQIKEANPTLKNTEVSRMLGEMWRNASEEDRRPHVEKEKREREKYKVAMADWRREYEARVESQKKAQAEQTAYSAHMYPREAQHLEHMHDGALYGENMAPPYPSQPPHMGPPSYGYGGPPPGYSPYAYGGNYQLPFNGKHPVILGPNGAPRYPVMQGYGGGPPMMQPPMQAGYGTPPSRGYEDPINQSSNYDCSPENLAVASQPGD